MRTEIHYQANVNLNEIDIAVLQTAYPGMEPGAAIKLLVQKLGQGDPVAREMRQVGPLLQQVVDRLDGIPQQISDLITNRFEQLADALAPATVDERS